MQGGRGRGCHLAVFVCIVQHLKVLMYTCGATPTHGTDVMIGQYGSQRWQTIIDAWSHYVALSDAEATTESSLRINGAA